MLRWSTSTVDFTLYFLQKSSSVKNKKKKLHKRLYYLCQTDLLIFQHRIYLRARQSSILIMKNDALCQDILPEQIIRLDQTNNSSRSEAFNLQQFKTHSLWLPQCFYYSTVLPVDLCWYICLLLLRLFTQLLPPPLLMISTNDICVILSL